MAVTNGCQRQGHTRGRTGREGFTLTEMLVVIGIVVLLMAISVSVGRSLREGNRMLACKSQLQQIGQAMKLYRMDEMGFPPLYITAAQDPAVDAPTGPGLTALYDTGYLTREMTLHCPRDFYTESDDADFLKSYQLKWDEDEDGVGEVGGETELNKYSYLPFRGVANPLDPYYRKQLMPGAGAGVPQPYVDPDWHPLDDTVVTWCPHHLESMTTNGEAQYLVLFWDGTVSKVAQSLMEDTTVGNEAWKVTHSDASG